MSSTGFLQIHAYASNAQLPLNDVSVIVTSEDRHALAARLTNESGLTDPISIPVPDKSESQEPGAADAPYTLVNIYAALQGYERIAAEGIQIFPGVTTYQDLEMLPLPEYPLHGNDITRFFTTPQNL